VPCDAPASFSTSIWAMTTITKEGDCGEEGVGEEGHGGPSKPPFGNLWERERAQFVMEKKSWKMGK